MFRSVALIWQYLPFVKFDTVWWISNADIEAFKDTKHPFGVKKICRGILVVGIPRCEFARGGCIPAITLQQFSDFGAEFYVIIAAFVFLLNVRARKWRSRTSREVRLPLHQSRDCGAIAGRGGSRQ